MTKSSSKSNINSAQNILKQIGQSVENFEQKWIVMHHPAAVFATMYIN